MWRLRFSFLTFKGAQKGANSVKKLISVLLILIVTLLVCTGCSSSDDGKRVKHAKIRYFDGTVDTIEIKNWFASQSGTVTLNTSEGRKVVLGVNNVIIIEETEYQYNH